MSARATIKRAFTVALGEDRSQRLLMLRHELFSRLSYSSFSSGRASQVALKGLRNSHRGERCFIIGNGPSLKGMDLSPLKNEFTFGLNRIYLLFESIGFATNCIVAVNRYVIEQCADDLASSQSLKFLSWVGRQYVHEAQDVIFVRPALKPGFAFDPTHGLWEGATVTFIALQLAFWMGFSEVVLIGVDHSFKTKGPPHQLVTATEDDPNHFHPSYFGPGFRWQLPDLETSELAYMMARLAFEDAGRRVLDATLNGKLEVFDKVPFTQVVGATKYS